jgi:hypothetical protein
MILLPNRLYLFLDGFVTVFDGLCMILTLGKPSDYSFKFMLWDSGQKMRYQVLKNSAYINTGGYKGDN